MPGRFHPRMVTLPFCAAALLWTACNPEQFAKTKKATSQAATEISGAAQEEIIEPAVETIRREGREWKNWAKSTASQAATQIAPRMEQARDAARHAAHEAGVAATQAADKVRRAASRAAEEFKK